MANFIDMPSRAGASALTRRSFLVGAPLVLAGCVASANPRQLASLPPTIDPAYLTMYGPVYGEPFPVPAIDLTRIIDQKFLRQEVAYLTNERPGTIVVDPNEYFAYLVLENGRALRYGVGVGREATLNFQGEATIARKAEWPRWIPTKDMIARDPDRYAQFAGGMDGGPDNPLGPRALYLYQGGQDTYYRLHGNPQPWTIGTNVSSGCIRLLNQDIIDLYGRVPVGARAVVLPIHGSAVA